MKTETTMEAITHPPEGLKLQRLAITNAGEVVEQLEHTHG